jgi:mRNA interferase RelE/StbE
MYNSHVRYEIRWLPPVRRELKRVPARERQRIYSQVGGLADKPRPAGFERLSGLPDLWRIRVGRYRVVYQIQGSVAVVAIVRVAKRDEVYRQSQTLRERLRPSDR